MITKNVAGQKLAVYAFDSSGDPVTGDSANITAEISIDGGTSAATNDLNPTEIDATDHAGMYVFDLTQAETNGDMLNITPVSATSGVLLDKFVIYPNADTSTAIAAAVWAHSTGSQLVANVTTLLGRITSTLFTGITSLAEWLGAGFGKQIADGTAVTEIRATGAGSGTFDATTDSVEAIRDRGDAAWGDPSLLQSTTVSTLTSQTIFTLSDGSVDDGAYDGAIVVITDSVTSAQKSVGTVMQYTGATKAVVLKSDPSFTIAPGDNIDIIAGASSENQVAIESSINNLTQACCEGKTMSCPTASSSVVTLVDNGNGTCTLQVDEVSCIIQTQPAGPVSVSEIADSAGTDDAGCSYSIGDHLIRLPGGQVYVQHCIPGP